jgi:DNA-binding response OmpR family regulator
MDGNKIKIVIAEDDHDLCEVLKSVMREEGYAAHCVHDGFALISHLKEVQDVDVVILDLVMPDKGGISIFDTIRSVAPATKIIIYTGFTNYRHSVFGRSADGFVGKAEGAEKLLNTLKEVLS